MSTLHGGPRRAREHQLSEAVRTVRRRLAFQRSEPSVKDQGLRKREGCWGKRASSPSLSLSLSSSPLPTCLIAWKPPSQLPLFADSFPNLVFCCSVCGGWGVGGWRCLYLPKTPLNWLKKPLCLRILCILQVRLSFFNSFVNIILR